LPGTAAQPHGAYVQTTYPSGTTDPGVPVNAIQSYFISSNNSALSLVDGSVVAVTSLQGTSNVATARGSISVAAVTSANTGLTYSDIEGATGRVWTPSSGASGSSTITNARALRGDLWLQNNTTTVTNGYGLYIDAPTLSGGGSITNFNGIYIEDLTFTSTTKNAIFYDGTGSNVPFVVTYAGSTGIGTPTPSDRLEVRNGNVLLSNNTGTAAQLRFMNPAATFNSTFAAGAQTATYNYTLPASLPTTNQVLTATSITGAGPYAVTLGWSTPAGGSSWGLTGNGGTVAGTSFVGTTDNIELDIRTNNIVRLRFNTTTNSIQRGTTGNARGTDAIDLQATRAAVTQVAGATGSVIAGGENNQIGTTATYSTINGGFGNTISGTNSSITGGNANTVSGTYGTVTGGNTNTASGTYNTVLGGQGLTLSGNYSVGYNAGSTAMSVSANNTTVLGNTSLWLANNNGTVSDLRFYTANSTAGAFPNTAKFSAIKAGAHTNDITYILPDNQPGAAGSMLQAQSITGTGPYSVQLSWSSGSSQGWLLTGNGTLDTATNYIGSTGNAFIEIRANSSASSGGNGRMFRFEPNGTSPNLIGGHRLNLVFGGFGTANRVYGATILGGGSDARPDTVT